MGGEGRFFFLGEGVRGEGLFFLSGKRVPWKEDERWLGKEGGGEGGWW